MKIQVKGQLYDLIAFSTKTFEEKGSFGKNLMVKPIVISREKGTKKPVIFDLDDVEEIHT